MRVLFDHNVPKQLRRSLSNHKVATAREMGWTQLENGDLLSAAQNAGFYVMVTGDKNLSYQQNLTGRTLALIVLMTNDWRVLRGNPAPIVEAINSATPGSFRNI